MTKRRKKARQPTGKAVRMVNTGYSEHAANHKNPALASWNPVASSPASDIDANLWDLHSRARDLQMGNAIAGSAVNTSRTNVIGAGLKVRPRIDRELVGLTLEEAAAWEKLTTKEFELWAGSKKCDLHLQNNFYDIQDINYSCYMVSGDSFALLKYRQATPDNPYHLRIQLLEADRVCNPDSNIYGTGALNVYSTNPANGNRIISGVEIDKDGAIVAYWISSRYLYDQTNLGQPTTWARVEAYEKTTGLPNILQTAHMDRPDQYRGVPYLAPVIKELKQVGRYTDAELTTAIIRSFMSLFFVQSKDAQSGIGFPIGDIYGQAEEPAPIDVNKFRLGPGTFNMLPPGYDVKTVTGNNASAYDTVTSHLVQQIGSNLEIPYEVLMKHFQSSYTAARGALLQAWAAFNMRRVWFTRDFCQPVYERWLVEAVAMGRIEAPGFFEDALIRKSWSKAMWYGPTIGVLDPLKEAQGAEKRIQLGLSTHEKECLELTGTGIEENIEQLAREKALMDKAGVITTVVKNIKNKRGGNVQ